MKINKTIALAFAASLLLAGCGSVEKDTEAVRATETQATQASSDTSPVIIETQISSETAPAVTEITADTSADTTTTAKTSSETSSQSSSIKIVLGAETTVSSQQAPQESTSVTYDTQQDSSYDHDQPMGNEVLPQSVDYYATDTRTSETQPPVTLEQPQQSEAQVQQPQVTDGGVTSKGYKIETVNGVTTVGGIIIANKTYSLPQDYGNGLNSEAQQAFYEMQAAAANDGIWLNIVSGYRSYWYQDQLYWGYVYTRGQEESDRFSAKAGHSEHQTGLAMDLNSASRTFIGTPEAQWIEAHCAEYGFIIRYPDGKEDVTGFMYEPWHVRYLGKEMARAVTDSGLALEEYLGIDSVYR